MRILFNNIENNPDLKDTDFDAFLQLLEDFIEVNNSWYL